ncbi:MAG: S41 family peptidase [Clostridia bacterium]|nr:S41 family peptidase [Clostridia bacterium]
MKKTIWLICLLLFSLLLTGCAPQNKGTTTVDSTVAPGQTAEELADQIEAGLSQSTEGKKYSYATEWLVFFGLKCFDQSKLQRVEAAYWNYFIKEVPPAETVARTVADLISQALRGGKLDHTDIVQMTDNVIYAYFYAVGDRYSNYFNEENYKDYTSEQSGNYEGIGVTVSASVETNEMLITTVAADSPAEKAGILAGDYIVAVEGIAVTEIGYNAAINMIRGEAGTSVSITILRGEDTFDVTVTRAALTEQTVTYKIFPTLGKQIGYVRITTFNEVTEEQFKTTIDALLDAQVDGLVFDLRNNGGGLLNTVLAMLDYLLPDGYPLANYVYYDGTKDVSYGQDKHHVDLPMAVICNAYTASAAELFSCALQDYDKKGFVDATVVGTVTYGKGTMQAMIDFRDGTAMTISFAYYQPPYSDNYEDIGVMPDIEVTLDDALLGYNPERLTYEQDAQLQAAISCLTEK